MRDRKAFQKDGIQLARQTMLDLARAVAARELLACHDLEVDNFGMLLSCGVLWGMKCTYYLEIETLKPKTVRIRTNNSVCLVFYSGIPFTIGLIGSCIAMGFDYSKNVES